MIPYPTTVIGGRIEARVGLGDILGHGILWILISIVTLGIGLFFYPYSFAKFILNRTYVYNADGVQAKLHCDLDIVSQLGHILGWFLLTLITFGLAYPIYLYKTWNFALNHTHFVPA